jgi:ubiquitin-protein ligase
MKPPIVKLSTKIYNWNFNDKGSISLDILERKDRWIPSMNLVSLAIALRGLITHPNPHGFIHHYLTFSLLA